GLRGLRSDHHKTSSIFSERRAEGCNLGKTVGSGGLTQKRVYPQEYRTNVADNLACRSNRPARIECEAESISGPRLPVSMSRLLANTGPSQRSRSIPGFDPKRTLRSRSRQPGSLHRSSK